jgi:hypothetical protein
MRERPVLFNGAMVRAILAGQKTQTRRAVKGVALDWLGKAQFTPEYVASPDNDLCPFGQAGDRLWVRETWRPETIHSCAMDTCDCDSVGVSYAADGEWIPHTWQNPPPDEWYMPAAAARGNVPSIHMPRWACRLVLEITNVRVERLQAISEADAKAEGLSQTESGSWLPGPCEHPEWAFHQLWAQVYGEPAWEANPWVWVIEFDKINEVSNG